MTAKDRKIWADKIALYILANEPVTLDALEDRAKKHSWYNWNEFDAILLLLKKDTRISATLTKSGVIYKKKKEYVSPLIAERERIDRYLRSSYPVSDINPDDCPFKICFCAIWRTDNGEVYNEEKHEHRPDCDAVRFKEEWEAQTPLYGRQRKLNPNKDIEVAQGEQLLLLA